jgi:hypothetical protein
MKEYRTYGMKPETSWSPSPCQGTVVLENCCYDWRYASGADVSLEILGEQGWELIQVMPSRDGYYVGIFERDKPETKVEEPKMCRDVLRAIVVKWFGSAYDEAGEYPGNPDYYGAKEVDELVEQLEDAAIRLYG